MSQLPPLPFSPEPELIAILARKGMIRQVPKGAVLLREGAHVASVPVVISGLLRVDKIEEERELLLYFIQPGQSCIMSFSAMFQGMPSRVMAVAEEDSEVLLLPVEELPDWHRRFPSLQRYYLELYQKYYDGLLTTIDVLAFQRMDARILAYLEKRAEATGKELLDVTHQQIAQAVGSTREVVSRVLKKLETEGHVRLGRNEVEVRRSSH